MREFQIVTLPELWVHWYLLQLKATDVIIYIYNVTHCTKFVTSDLFGLKSKGHSTKKP